MELQPRRAARYYYLRFLRLQGDPRSIARGFALGIFIGVTPTIPLHTILIVLLSGSLRGNFFAALVGATFISNPLTFFLQYHLSWQIGKVVISTDVSWEKISSLLDFMTSDASFMDSFRAMSDLGGSAVLTLLTGGVLLAIPFTVAGYFTAFQSVKKYRQKQYKKRLLS